MFQEKRQKTLRWPLWLMTTVAVGIALTSLLGGIFIGREALPPRSVTLEDGRVIGAGEIARIAEDVDFQLFWDVWQQVQEDYVYGPVAEKDLFYGALHGLVAGLGDPYTTFFDPKAANSFQTSLSGQFEGIGAEIGLREGQLVIVSPLRDSPAQLAGIAAGDAIYLIDETETAGLSIEDAVALIRGPKGTTVTLTVVHEGANASVEVPIHRAIIELSSVEWSVREDGIAVIDIFAFNEDTARRFNDAVVDVLSKGATGLVIDMRNNPGGFLDQAVVIAGEWVGNNTVVIERGEDGVMKDIEAQGVARLKDIPTVVIVNEGSASATEIVAGALQDYASAIIIGAQTFGKGSVQEYRELSDGSALKITIAEWLTPQGRSINKQGITPDEEVTFTEEDLAEGIDTQFERALSILNEEHGE
ncbi:peptidase S41 [Candidatus Uhrbacteria bacterium CG10_big_fil_rev_8_21_14_0_10_50_16]|uniref:Peptidase S41 n=1 Tax=Candidatus Uhrbacteria bacterium CG10_big_fil_rev_8_21_14_0_10_50_16 TaxID=1975039 RepID=A0A2H0RLF9_9BACT|nr:MAG: peptidase S41 [Candidatus Uhrbacteria bacterium CG10_big_fil_rev_8_21_14_0_10_50_16]